MAAQDSKSECSRWTRWMLYDLLWPSLGNHRALPLSSYLVKAVTSPPGFMGGGHRPHLSMGEMWKTLQPFFKMVTHLHTQECLYTHTQIHVCIYIYTQYTPIHKHTHTQALSSEPLFWEQTLIKIHVHTSTHVIQTHSHKYIHSHTWHTNAHTRMLTATGPAPEMLTPTPAAPPACPLPHVWLSWGPGWARVAWLVWGGPSLLNTLPLWQGPGKKENK